MIFCEKKSFAQKSDGHEEKDLKKNVFVAVHWSEMIELIFEWKVFN